MLCQILTETIGPAGSIDGLGRLLREIVESGFGSAEGLRRCIAQSGGDGDAAGCAQNFAGDVGGVAKFHSQQLVELAEGEAGLGNLDLDLRSPVVLVGVRRSVRLGRGLHGLELVEEPGGDYLAVSPSRARSGGTENVSTTKPRSFLALHTSAPTTSSRISATIAVKVARALRIRSA